MINSILNNQIVLYIFFFFFFVVVVVVMKHSFDNIYDYNAWLVVIVETKRIRISTITL